MILNSETVQLVRINATRLAQSVQCKDDLADFATASNFEQIFSAIENLLTNTNMYFDDEILSELTLTNWQSFKATLLVYTLNIVNKNETLQKRLGDANTKQEREFGACGI